MALPLIAIDARHVRPGMTGVGRRTAHLLQAAIAQGSDFRWGLFTNEPEFLRAQLRTGTLELWPTGVRPESHPANEWWLNRTVPAYLRAHGAALIDCPAFLGPWRPLSIPIVLTVHDMAHLHRPSTQPLPFRQFLRLAVARGARVAARIIVPSASVQYELSAAVPSAARNIRVIPGGVSPEVRPMEKDAVEAFRGTRRLPRNFLLHVGTFEPRKNHRFLLEIHNALCAEMDDPPALVMVGEPGPTLGLVARWRDESPWRDCIRMCHGMGDDDLLGFMNAASALVFPSVSEGFGLPVLEAAACGLPVTAARVSGLVDLAHLPVTLLPLGAVQPWVRHIRALLGDPMLRGRLREAASDIADQNSWSLAADSLLDLYREVLVGARGVSARAH